MRICGVVIRVRVLAIACAGFLLALALGAGGRAAFAQTARVQRLTLPSNHLLRPTGDRNSLAITPDGSRFVYVTNNRLFLKPLGQGEAMEISGTAARQGGISNPIVTPDGQAVVFWTGEDGGALQRIAIGGGTPTKICAADNPYGMAWGANGTLLVGQGPKGILSVPATGGTPETLVGMKEGEWAHGPQLLPGGDAILYTLIDAKTANTDGWDRARIVVQPLRGGARKVVIEQGRDARYLANGYLLYALDNRLMAVKFDAKSRAVSGKAATLVDDVHTAANVGTAHFTVSDPGALVYWPERSGETQFGLVGLDGTKKILGPAINFANAPRVSPDGKRVAMSGVGDGNLWITELDNPGGLHKFLKGSYYNFPVFSEDGKYIVFGTNLPNGVETVYAMPSSLSGEIEVLARPARAPESWKQGTQTFSYITRRGVMDYDLWTFDLATQTFAPLVNIPVSAQLSSRFSPDGKWVAYMSNETGDFEVWAEPYPATTQRYRVSQQGGRAPLWSLDGSELYYDSNGKMFAVKFQGGTQPFGPQRELPISGFIPTGLRRTFDLLPDGKTFVMLFRSPSTVGIVSNWTTLLPAP